VTSRVVKSPLKLSKKSIKVVKGKKLKKGNQTQRSTTTLSSQLMQQLASRSSKLNSVAKEKALKTSRSRNHSKIGESRDIQKGFQTHRVQNNNLSENGLLGMFTSFLTSDKKTFKERKNSHKNQYNDLVVTQKNLLSALNKHKSHKVIDKSQDEPVNLFNIFKGS
jgi:hypothetical protein